MKLCEALFLKIIYFNLYLRKVSKGMLRRLAKSKELGMCVQLLWKRDNMLFKKIVDEVFLKRITVYQKQLSLQYFVCICQIVLIE